MAKRRPHVSVYNSQQLFKELRNMTPEQRNSPWWWTHLSPKWDNWTKDQLEQLVVTTQSKDKL